MRWLCKKKKNEPNPRSPVLKFRRIHNGNPDTTPPPDHQLLSSTCPHSSGLSYVAYLTSKHRQTTTRPEIMAERDQEALQKGLRTLGDNIDKLYARPLQKVKQFQTSVQHYVDYSSTAADCAEAGKTAAASGAVTDAATVQSPRFTGLVCEGCSNTSLLAETWRDKDICSLVTLLYRVRIKYLVRRTSSTRLWYLWLGSTPGFANQQQRRRRQGPLEGRQHQQQPQQQQRGSKCSATKCAWYDT